MNLDKVLQSYGDMPYYDYETNHRLYANGDFINLLGISAYHPGYMLKPQLTKNNSYQYKSESRHQGFICLTIRVELKKRFGIEFDPDQTWFKQQLKRIEQHNRKLRVTQAQRKKNKQQRNKARDRRIKDRHRDDFVQRNFVLDHCPYLSQELRPMTPEIAINDPLFCGWENPAMDWRE